MERLEAIERRALWIFAAILLGWLLQRAVRNLTALSPEDFVYYHAGTSMYLEGENPYERFSYQKRLEPLIGGANRFPSREHAWLYPPAMAYVFAPFVKTENPLRAYRAWSIVLGLFALAACIGAARSVSGPALLLFPAILLFAPGADNAFYAHRVVWLSLVCFAAGTALIEKGRSVLGGAVLGVLGVQPQWLAVAALCLALGRAWKALLSLCAVAALPFLPYLLGLRPIEELSLYLMGLQSAGAGTIFSGHLGLAAGAYRLGLAALGLPWGGAIEPSWAYQVLWISSMFFVGALSGAIWLKKIRLRDKMLFSAAFAVWVQPYSHGSEMLWLIPGFLAALSSRFKEEREFSRACVIVLGATALLRVFLDFDGGRGFIATAYLFGLIGLLFWRGEGEGDGRRNRSV